MKSTKSEARNPKNTKGNYAFIDSQNLNLGVKASGWKFDFAKFRLYLTNKYNVQKAYLFIGQLAGNESLYDSLQDMGYHLILKPTTEYRVDGKIMVKGNVDAELVLYAAAKAYDNYDKAVLVSGDGDFMCLADYLSEKNKLLNIMVPNKKYSKLFKRHMAYIVRVDLLKNSLEYKKDQRRRSVETLGLSGHGDKASIAQNNEKSNLDDQRNKKDQTRRSVETLGLSGNGDTSIIIQNVAKNTKKQGKGNS